MPKHGHEAPADRNGRISKLPVPGLPRRMGALIRTRPMVLPPSEPALPKRGGRRPSNRSVHRQSPVSFVGLPQRTRRFIAVALPFQGRSLGRRGRGRLRRPATMASPVRACRSKPDPTAPRRRSVRNVDRRPSPSRCSRCATWVLPPRPHVARPFGRWERCVSRGDGRRCDPRRARGGVDEPPLGAGAR